MNTTTESAFMEELEQLPTATVARKLAAFPIFDGEDRINKELALEFAEYIGTEEGQLWYRFIVLVTKLTKDL